MIDFTIKTLESINHQFSVEDETTVAQLKEQIRDEMGIEIEMQRLIFCGRVLTDERKLSEFDVNGKVIHLVPRPPPSPQSRNAAHINRPEMRDVIDDAQRAIDRMTTQPNARSPSSRQSWMDPPSDLVLDQQQALSMSPVSSRLDFLRRTLDDIRNALATLAQLQMEAATESMESDSMEQGTPPESLWDERSPFASPVLPFPPNRREENVSSNATGSGGGRMQYSHSRRPLRPSNRNLALPRDLAALLDEMEQLREQFAPYQNLYTALLRNTDTLNWSLEECARNRVLVEQCRDVMHSFAHAYHAASDIQISLGGVTRLLAEHAPNRHQLPVQAHINVVHTARRPEGLAAANAGQNANRATAPTNIFTAMRTQRINPGTSINVGPPNNTGAPINPGAPTNPLTNPGSPINPGISNPGTSINFGTPMLPRPHIVTGIPIAQMTPGSHITFGGPFSFGTPMNFILSNTEVLNSTVPTTTTNTGAASDAQNQGASGRNQTAVNPESVTYQVEIETRVPIALPVDDDFFNNFADASDLQGQRQDLGQGQGQGRTQTQTQTEGQGQPQAQTTFGQDPAQPQTARPRFVTEIENLLRTLSQAHPGVEVVMSMEEMHPVGPYTIAPEISNLYGNRPTTSSGPGYATFGFATVSSGGEGADAARAAGENGANTDANAGWVRLGPGLGSPRFGLPIGVSTTDASSFNTGASFTVSAPTGAGSSGLGGPTFTLQPEGGVFLAPMGPNITGQGIAGVSSEMLQNVFSSIFRPATNNAQNAANAAPNNFSATGANAEQTNAGPGVNSATASNAMPAFMGGSNNANQNNASRTTEGNAGMASGQPMPHVIYLESSPGRRPADPRRRDRDTGMPAGDRPQRSNQSNARAHQIAIASMVYDPFLNCDTALARQHVTRHRTAYQELYNQQMMMRSLRNSEPSIYRLEERNHNFSTRHMAIMMRLLSGPASPEARLNAFMTTVARMLFLEPDRQPITHDPLSMPREFISVRAHMREYIQRHLRVVSSNIGFRSVYERMADVILGEHQAFFDRLNEITPIVPEANVMRTLREWLRMRIPVIIACLMTEIPTNTFVTRFYATFTHFYSDLCSQVMQFCIYGFGGLRTLHTAFINDITRNSEVTAREWLQLVSMENLTAIQNNIDPLAPNNFEQPRQRQRIVIPATPPPPPRGDAPSPRSSAVSSRTDAPPPRNDSPPSRSNAPPSRSDAPSPRSDVPSSRSDVPSPRDDAPTTVLTRPWLSIPNLFSSSLISELPAPLDPENIEISQLLDFGDDSIADTSSSASRNSIPRSPVETLSSGTSPRRDCPVQVTLSVQTTPTSQITLSGSTTEHVSNGEAIDRRPSTSTTSKSNPIGLSQMLDQLTPLPAPRKEAVPTRSWPVCRNLFASSSESSSLVGPEPEDNDNENLPLLDYINESTLDSNSSTSHSSVTRSPVHTQSAGTSPTRNSSDPLFMTVQSPSSELSDQNRFVTMRRADVQNVSSSPFRINDQSVEAQSSQVMLSDLTSSFNNENNPAFDQRLPTTSAPASPSLRMNWEEQWLPVISRDQRLQRDHERPQEPFSDAYLCGMPSRKRRCVRATRPPSSLEGFMDESVRDVTESHGSLDTSEIRTRMVDSMRSFLRTRADNSEDFDPTRFGATARFLDDTKSSREETDTKVQDQPEDDTDDPME